MQTQRLLVSVWEGAVRMVQMVGAWRRKRLVKILVKGKKGSLRQIVYVVIFLAAVIALFQWYSVQNRKRISEQNKNYAADSARQMAVRINDELKNALNLIDTYTYFLG